jgi:hypothetical protein
MRLTTDGVDRLADSRRFGLGQETGVEMLSEKGFDPFRRMEAKCKGEQWFPGETYRWRSGRMVSAPLFSRFPDQHRSKRWNAIPTALIRVWIATGRLSSLARQDRRGWSQFGDAAIAGCFAGWWPTSERGKIVQVEIAGKTGTAQVIGTKLAADQNNPKRFKTMPGLCRMHLLQTQKCGY